MHTVNAANDMHLSQFVNMSAQPLNQLTQYAAHNVDGKFVFIVFLLLYLFNLIHPQQSIKKSMETVIVISAE